MQKNFSIKTVTSAGAGGIIYGIVVILLNYFAPIIGFLAGFISGAVLVVLNGRDEEDNMDISTVNLLKFAGVAIISLLIGYIMIYYLKTEVIHNTSYHPQDFLKFTDFILSTLGIPDILSTITGGLIALLLSDKISAVYMYFRGGPPV